jgi:hypothetical protein
MTKKQATGTVSKKTNSFIYQRDPSDPEAARTVRTVMSRIHRADFRVKYILPRANASR